MLKQFHDMKDLFEDTVTRLPHHVLLQPLIEKSLREDASLGLIVINLEGLDPIEETYGHAVYQTILRNVSAFLQSLKGTTIRDTDYLALSELGGSSFMVFLTANRRGKSKRQLKRVDIDTISERLRSQVLGHYISLMRTYVKGLPKISIGNSFVVSNPLIRKRRLINKLIEEAKEMARLEKPIMKGKYREILHRMIVNREIKTVFQPIVYSMHDKVMGIEALSRGPKGTIFESPLSLYSIAEEVNLTYELDRLCRQTALLSASPVSSQYKIFVNTLPKAIQDPEFQNSPVKMKGNNIVYEINEREAIGSFPAFKHLMQQCVSQGIDFAVDDIGAGYSSLETIVQLKPKYMKLDRSLISDIREDSVRQDMLKMLVKFADKINATIIAEGIETKEDSTFVRNMGVSYMQGYYYAKPMSLDELLKTRWIK